MKLLKSFLRLIGVLLFALLVFGGVLAARNEIICTNWSVNETPSERGSQNAKSAVIFVDALAALNQQDFAKVIETSAPHDFGYFSRIWHYWRGLCSISNLASASDNITFHEKARLYGKALSYSYGQFFLGLYEISIGRVFYELDGKAQSPMEKFYAKYARSFANELTSNSWFEQDVDAAIEPLKEAELTGLRDWERWLFLRSQLFVHSLHNWLFTKASNLFNTDNGHTRFVVSDVTAFQIEQIDGVKILNLTEEGIEIESSRQLFFTELAKKIINAGGRFVSIANMDRVLVLRSDGESGAVQIPRPLELGQFSFDWIDLSDLSELLKNGQIQYVFVS